MNLVKTKVDVDKTCWELKEQLGEIEAGQHLPEAAKRAVIEEHLKSSYFISIRQELAWRVAITIKRELRTRHSSLDLSFMTLHYGLGLEPLSTSASGGSTSQQPSSTSSPQGPSSEG